VSGGSDKTHKVLKPFCVVNVRGPQVFQAIQRAEVATIEDYMTSRVLLSTTDAFGLYLACPNSTGMYQSGRRQFLT